MATEALSKKAIGSKVKLKVGGVDKTFLVVNQGKPSTIYDDSCNGTWLLMEDIYETRAWHSSNVNKLESSTIHTYLNGDFLNKFEANIKDAIKSVKIPYRQNGGSGGTDRNGANGLQTKIFLLSGYECGWTTSDYSYFPVDGAKLAYFESGTGSSANAKRVAKYNNSAGRWWLRSPGTSGTSSVVCVFSGGHCNYGGASNAGGVRPALILPSELLVSDDGTVSTNEPPVINTSSTDLGVKNAEFSVSYSVTDADDSSVTVTETVDSTQIKSHSPALGQSVNADVKGDNWKTLLNGAHQLKISATDGKDTTEKVINFQKKVTKAVITLTKALTADAKISVAVLSIDGDIPDDADLKVEVTNNGNDDSPVWEVATTAVKTGKNIVFTNDKATKGFAFNFRITVSRGVSDKPGYINSIQGGFQ